MHLCLVCYIYRVTVFTLTKLGHRERQIYNLSLTPPTRLLLVYLIHGTGSDANDHPEMGAEYH